MPAHGLAFFKQGHVVPAFGRHPRRFHARRASAHNHHAAFGAGGLLNDVWHAHVFAGGGGVLNAQHVQPLILTVDAIVGAHALFDLIDLAHFDFRDQVRVSDVGTGHADHVHITAFQDARGLGRVFDVLCVQHRRLDHLLDARRQVQERLRRVAHVRDDVGQRVVGVAARADHADEIQHAGVVVILCNLLHVLVAQAIGVKLVAAQANAHTKIRADFGTHRFEHFKAKTHAVFKTAAPFVGAFVDARAPELVDHVLVHRRQLHAVQPTCLGPARGAGVVADDAPDFFGFDGFAGGAVHRFAHA